MDLMKGSERTLALSDRARVLVRAVIDNGSANDVEAPLESLDLNRSLMKVSASVPEAVVTKRFGHRLAARFRRESGTH